MFNPVKYFFHWTAHKLAAVNLIDRTRGDRIAALAWPRSLTMFARNSQRTADVAMVGLTVGPAAIAGIAFATLYWKMGNVISGGGIAGGTISQVSQRFGAEKFDAIDLVIKQSGLVAVALSIPLTLVFVFFAEPLIAIFTSDGATIAHGATYLRIQSVAMVVFSLNLVSSRVLAGADDTWIAMSVRATGAATNIVLNAIFIFGLGMGVTGAALGTVIAEILVVSCFALGFIFGRLPVIGEFPVQITLTPPYVEAELLKQLVEISIPITIQKVAERVARFPLFVILAMFGPLVVAAFEVGRRIRNMMAASGRGLDMSASSLVGQALGQEDEMEADSYVRDIMVFSLVIFVASSALVFVFAEQIALLFVDEPDAVSQTTPFIRVTAVSFLGFGFARVLSGVLKAAGDNTWSMYGQFVGKYLVLLPIAYLGVVTPLGIVAVYVAMVAETASAAAVTGYRVVSGKWKIKSRQYRPQTADD